jgi:DNA-binding MarR family transcriptional regulator
MMITMSQDTKANPADPAYDGAAMELIVSQWRHERPDIDPEPMAVCGEIWRAADRLRQGVLVNWSKWGLDLAGSDVMLTLRRQGKGKTMSPSDLAKEMMLSTSAMTNRLDRLEKRGLIERNIDRNDRRGIRIELTDEGFSLADEMIVSHVETEERLISKLAGAERKQLRELLTKIGA